MAHPGSQSITVTSTRHDQMVNITDQVAALVPAGLDGMCFLFCQHTTAGLTVNENADPDVVHDLLLEFERLAPWRNPAFRHGEGNSAAHVKSSLVGVQLAIPVRNGRLELGVWQGIFFCEFDGPRQRRVLAHFLADSN